MKRIFLSLLLLVGVANFQLSIFNFQLGLVQAQRVTDKLDRGLVAVPSSTSGNLVSWRIFAEEYYGVTYNLYANGTLVGSNLKASNYNHTGGNASTKYQVAAVVKGVEQAKSAEVTRWNEGYKQFAVAKVVDRDGK
ncbi:MAG: hypothetical protein IKQ20_10085, partial [Bacteroidales bacterium]|nr:hypothetical protein [Bacteroidales bacterium]